MYLNITTAVAAKDYKDSVINDNDKLGTVTIARGGTLKFAT
jgi:hypothetical protein